MLPRASRDHYQRQQALGAAVLRGSRRQWASMSFDFDRSWPDIRSRLVALAVAAQLAATRDANAYVDEVLDETGQANNPVAVLRPPGFVGTSSDGRDIETLFDGAIVAAKGAVAAGATAPDALTRGGQWLDMTMRTLVADAGRTASGVAIAVRPDVGGYVRMLNPPSCSRCVVLAGQFYRWNDGFQRHPGCDCRHIPSSENIAGDITTDPSAYFKSLGEAEQDQTFGKAGAQAIRDGADIAQVVNARRANTTYTTDLGFFTREGTTRGAQRIRGVVRPMPETIYTMAGGDRGQAIELLRRYGYIAT